MAEQGDIVRAVHIQFTKITGSRGDRHNILILFAPGEAKFGVKSTVVGLANKEGVRLLLPVLQDVMDKLAG